MFSRIGTQPFKAMAMNMGSTLGKVGAGIGGMFAEGGFMGAGGFMGKAMSGISAAAPAIGVAQMVLGSFGRARANKKLAKDLDKQMKTQIKMQGNLTGETAQALEQLQDRTQLQEQAMGEAAGEGYEDIVAAEGTMQSATKGLKTGTVEMKKAETLGDLQTNWSQQLSQLEGNYKDTNKAFIDSVEDQQFQFGENMKKMAKARKKAWRHRRWYRNLI